MWMLLLYLQSPVVPDALKPVETFYQSEAACQDALAAEAEQKHFNGECFKVTWK